MNGATAGVLDGPTVLDSYCSFISAENGREVEWVNDVQQGSHANTTDAFGTSDIGFDSTGFTVIILRGVSGGFRMRIGGTMEAVPTSASDEIPYVTSPNGFDPEALKVYEQIRNEMPFAFPGKYNFLGFLSGLLPKIISGISAVGKFLAPVARTALSAAAVDTAQRVVHAVGGTPPEHAKSETIAAKPKPGRLALPNPKTRDRKSVV